MGKKLTAVLLSLAILLTGCPVAGAASAGNADSPASERMGTSIKMKECRAVESTITYRQITMYDEYQGWALTTENEVLFTDRGIENFTIIKNPDQAGIPADGFAAAAFPDERTAYLAYFAAEDMLVVEYTHDGGLSWQTTVLDYAAFGDTCDAGSVFLGFADGQNGYLLYCSTPAAGSMTKILLGTSDGGEHFSFLADLTNRIAGYPQGIAFQESKGYIAVSYHGEDSYLYASADGGMTWRDEKIYQAAEAVAYIDGYAPVFCCQDSNKGMIVLKTVKENVSYQICRTEDGGGTWELFGEISCDSLNGYAYGGDGTFRFWDEDGKLYELSE